MKLIRVEMQAGIIPVLIVEDIKGQQHSVVYGVSTDEQGNETGYFDLPHKVVKTKMKSLIDGLKKFTPEEIFHAVKIL